jgi:hypothetical protein
MKTSLSAFTRGSQLLSHFLHMFGAGVHFPFWASVICAADARPIFGPPGAGVSGQQFDGGAAEGSGVNACGPKGSGRPTPLQLADRTG